MLPHPLVALPIARILRMGEVVDGRTDIVIEAFPGSANTFAVAAFRLAQEPRACRIAHHTHMPAQVIQAIRLQLPALVVVREPERALLSMMIRYRKLTPQISQEHPGFVQWAWTAGLRRWISFHQSLLPYRDGFVVGRFDQVTSDFGSVIQRVNRRFGTSFHEFQHTDANLARILAEIDAHERTKHTDGEEVEREIPRPSRVREGMKGELLDAYRRAPSAVRGRAEALFIQLSA
jgi:hypothetical protein